MSDLRKMMLVMAITVVLILATRGLLSIAHDGLSPDWLWP